MFTLGRSSTKCIACFLYLVLTTTLKGILPLILNWGNGGSGKLSDLSKVTQLVRGNDLFLTVLHVPLVQNSDVLEVMCFQRHDQKATSQFSPGLHLAAQCSSCLDSEISLLAQKWIHSGAGPGWALKAAPHQIGLQKVSRTLIRGSLCIPRLVKLYDSKESIICFIYCRLAALGFAFSSHLQCLLHDRIIFISLFLSEPWNSVRNFLVQAFERDTSTQVGHLGEIDKLLLQHGGWGDYLAKYHFRLWQKEISSNLSPLTFSSFPPVFWCHGNDICESQGPLTVVSV